MAGNAKGSDHASLTESLGYDEYDEPTLSDQLSPREIRPRPTSPDVPNRSLGGDDAVEATTEGVGQIAPTPPGWQRPPNNPHLQRYNLPSEADAGGPHHDSRFHVGENSASAQIDDFGESARDPPFESPVSPATRELWRSVDKGEDMENHPSLVEFREKFQAQYAELERQGMPEVSFFSVLDPIMWTEVRREFGEVRWQASSSAQNPGLGSLQENGSETGVATERDPFSSPERDPFSPEQDPFEPDQDPSTSLEPSGDEVHHGNNDYTGSGGRSSGSAEPTGNTSNNEQGPHTPQGPGTGHGRSNGDGGRRDSSDEDSNRRRKRKSSTTSTDSDDSSSSSNSDKPKPSPKKRPRTFKDAGPKPKGYRTPKRPSPSSGFGSSDGEDRGGRRNKSFRPSGPRPSDDQTPLIPDSAKSSDTGDDGNSDHSGAAHESRRSTSPCRPNNDTTGKTPSPNSSIVTRSSVRSPGLLPHKVSTDEHPFSRDVNTNLSGSLRSPSADDDKVPASEVANDENANGCRPERERAPSPSGRDDLDQYATNAEDATPDGVDGDGQAENYNSGNQKRTNANVHIIGSEKSSPSPSPPPGKNWPNVFIPGVNPFSNPASRGLLPPIFDSTEESESPSPPPGTRSHLAAYRRHHPPIHHVPGYDDSPPAEGNTPSRPEGRGPRRPPHTATPTHPNDTLVLHEDIYEPRFPPNGPARQRQSSASLRTAPGDTPRRPLHRQRESTPPRPPPAADDFSPDSVPGRRTPEYDPNGPPFPHGDFFEDTDPDARVRTPTPLSESSDVEEGANENNSPRVLRNRAQNPRLPGPRPPLEDLPIALSLPPLSPSATQPPPQQQQDGASPTNNLENDDPSLDPPPQTSPPSPVAPTSTEAMAPPPAPPPRRHLRRPRRNSPSPPPRGGAATIYVPPMRPVQAASRNFNAVLNAGGADERHPTMDSAPAPFLPALDRILRRRAVEEMAEMAGRGVDRDGGRRVRGRVEGERVERGAGIEGGEGTQRTRGRRRRTAARAPGNDESGQGPTITITITAPSPAQQQRQESPSLSPVAATSSTLSSLASEQSSPLSSPEMSPTWPGPGRPPGEVRAVEVVETETWATRGRLRERRAVDYYGGGGGGGRGRGRGGTGIARRGTGGRGGRGAARGTRGNTRGGRTGVAPRTGATVRGGRVAEGKRRGRGGKRGR